MQSVSSSFHLLQGSEMVKLEFLFFCVNVQSFVMGTNSLSAVSAIAAGSGDPVLLKITKVCCRLGVHSNSSYPGTLGPGSARISELPVT